MYSNLFYDLQERHGEVSEIPFVVSIRNWNGDFLKREGIGVFVSLISCIIYKKCKSLRYLRRGFKDKIMIRF
jgi:hypothetical protein